MRIAYLAMKLPPALGRGPACPAPSSSTTNTLPPDRQPGLEFLHDFSGAAAVRAGLRFACWTALQRPHRTLRLAAERRDGMPPADASAAAARGASGTAAESDFPRRRFTWSRLRAVSPDL